MRDIFFKNSFYIPTNPHKAKSRAWFAWEVWLRALDHKLVPEDSFYDAPGSEFNPKTGRPEGHYKWHMRVTPSEKIYRVYMSVGQRSLTD